MKKTMTVTPAKLEANRRNAQKCTGPKTAAGKAASKLNALKHGLLAQNVVVSGSRFKESPAKFKELCSRFYTSLSPVGPLEEMLVDQIVQASWRLRRARTAEVGEIILSVDEGSWARQHEAREDRSPIWHASGNAFREMGYSGVGNGLLAKWLREVRDRVQQTGELSKADVKIPMFGEPNPLSDELEKWRQQCAPPDPGVDPAAHREQTKSKLLARINKKLDLFRAREDECRSREESAEQARQSAAVLPPAQNLDRILRYETALERQLYRAMSQLERLQRRRLGEVIAAPLTVDVSANLGSEDCETKPQAGPQNLNEINTSTP